MSLGNVSQVCIRGVVDHAKQKGLFNQPFCVSDMYVGPGMGLSLPITMIDGITSADS